MACFLFIFGLLLCEILCMTFLSGLVVPFQLYRYIEKPPKRECVCFVATLRICRGKQVTLDFIYATSPHKVREKAWVVFFLLYFYYDYQILQTPKPSPMTRAKKNSACIFTFRSCRRCIENENVCGFVFMVQTI